jgi:hypothetical protein
MSCHHEYLGGERIQADGDEGSNGLSVEVGDHISIPGGGVVGGGYGVIGLGRGRLLGGEQLGSMRLPSPSLG